MDETATSEADRREHPRKYFTGPVQLILPGNRIIPGRSLNLSRGGMSVVVDLNLPTLSQCTVRFTLRYRDGSAQPIESIASAAHSVYSSAQDGFIVGLQFTEFPSAINAAVMKYLEE